MKSQFFPLAALLLSACGGAGSSSAVVEPVSGIAALRANADRLDAGLTGTTATPSDSLAVSGSATFEGVLVLGLLADSSLGTAFGGDLTMNVSFDDGEITGEAENFFERDGEALPGSLTVSNGQVGDLGGGVLVEAQLDGELEILGEMRDLQGGLGGFVFGENGEYISGTASVEFMFDLPADEETNVPVILDGGFAVERQ